MARPPKLKPEELIAWIEAQIANSPVEHEGHVWMPMDQPANAAELGISERTLRSMIKVPPIVKDRTTYADGTPVVLLRIGTPEPDNNRQTARKLANLFRKKMGKDVGKRDFGCLVGLVQTWPPGQQLAIFSTVLEDWSGFMAGVECALMDAEIAGETVQKRYWKYPCISAIRRFHNVALDLHNMS